MLAAVVATLGLLATVANGAPAVPVNKDLSVLHTVVVDILSAAATPTATTTTAAEATEFPSEEPAAFGLPVPQAAPCAQPTQTATPTTETAEAPAATTTAAAAATSEVPEAIVPVVPVQICTDKGSNCLTTLGSEFANIKLSWDNVATFSLGLDGLLVRLNDMTCVDAVPMDDATWYDLAFVECELPKYLEGAVQHHGNGIGNPTPSPAVGDDRSLVITQASQVHTTWYYNSTNKYLCADVDDGLNDIVKVCMYSDEGYAMLGTTEELKSAPRKNREVTMPVVMDDNVSVAEHLIMMLEAMTYDGSIFWADSWSTNIVSVMKYKMMGQKEEEINMDRDQINGVIYPLWQVINDCRTACDLYAWCRSFTFPITERVCRLSDSAPVIKGDEIDYENPDTVTFVQNANYRREDFVLPEDIKGLEEINQADVVEGQ